MKGTFGFGNPQLGDRSPQPAEGGTLADERQAILHPFEDFVTTTQVVDHTKGKPTHENGNEKDHNEL